MERTCTNCIHREGGACWDCVDDRGVPIGVIECSPKGRCDNWTPDEKALSGSEAINKFLTEQMGRCWHTVEAWGIGRKCSKCGLRGNASREIRNLDFQTWADFGALWTWARQQPWWDKLLWKEITKNPNPLDLVLDMVDPSRFSNMVYKFLKEKGGVLSAAQKREQNF